MDYFSRDMSSQAEKSFVQPRSAFLQFVIQTWFPDQTNVPIFVLGAGKAN